jgi:hypothetical protein
MTTRLSFLDFNSFVKSTISGVGGWDEVPDWLAPYWEQGRPPSADLAALHADLDAKATRAEEFIARFVAWKLKR